MSSNLYLFDPKQAQADNRDKPLIQVMRDAELARAEESARILKRFVTRVSSLFGAKQPVPVAKPAANTAAVPSKEERLAA